MTEITEKTEKSGTAKGERKRWLTRLAVFFGIALLAYLIYWLCWGQFHLYTDDAYVGGNVVPVMAQINGTVTAIHTDNTQWVTAGQVLVELDKTDTAIALQKAKADLAETVRNVREYYENAARAENVFVIQEANLTKAQLDFNRRDGLVRARAISREEEQQYKTALLAARAQYNVALHNLRTALALVDNTHLYTHPLVQQAKAALRKAYLNAERAVVVAPVAGYVANRTVEVGQTVGVETPLLSIVPLNEIWVDANYKETQLAYLRIGQPVDLTADTYGDVTFHGKIVGLTPGTGPIFSLLPAQNATGNWIKILQRLPVRISLDPDEIKQHPLFLGLSMAVTTNIHDTSGKQLATVAQPKIRYQTSSYAKQLAGVTALINTILHKNGPDVAFRSSVSLAKASL